MASIPLDYVNYKSTSVFEINSVPKMFLHLHNTKAGVFGQIHVLNGELKFYGFTDRRGEIEQELIIKGGEVAVSPPQYWHKVEFLTQDTRFRVDFWAHKDSEIVAQNLSERDE
ncbi:DUF1971 domain-containing protein [Shewanella pneumatophori]|uniref:DUF1971 domain-containing protein n=1 Tax=Shewanella pneumatophori TaxID=314092 RepID=A0A9X1ZF41_9GAMM|nr:DUF1971 domain-containing protein [Shewanella pneumatophori]MCL1138742.1 DUF1971 domain-containing protein [Shewanella pneumatophori]